jgi:hypothetical protein
LGDFIPPRDGGIACSDRGDDKGTCYLITDGKKAAFTSSDVFTQLGFNFNHAVTGDVSFLPSASNINDATHAHLPGTLINDNGTIKLMGTTGTIGVPSEAILKSWGYSLADVVPANNADKSMTQTYVLYLHTAGELAPTFTAPVPSPSPTPPGSSPSPAPTPTPPSQVNIIQLTPSSGPIGTVVTVTGSNFTSSGNYVLFGSASVLASMVNANTLEFSVPSTQPKYCSQFAPCPGVMEPLPLGNYNVRVGNANGMSDVLHFTVTAE